MNDLALLRGYLHKLGLSKEAVYIYITLLQQGSQSITDISRHSGVERTKVYRTLPELDAFGFIDTMSDNERGMISATPFDNVQILLSKKEQELEDLKRSTARVARAVRELDSQAPRTNARIYRGPDGVKQMLWNETKANGELLSILRHGIQLDTRQKFFDRWVAACNQRDIVARSIIDAEFEDRQDVWRRHREVERLNSWQARVSPRDFTIEHDMIIYNDTVGYFYWGEDEVFGIEITNPLVARTQRQFFELLWNMSQQRAG